mgnify:CR=1 FL=1
MLGLGFIIAAVSVVGIFAGRTNSRTLLFVYFMSILLVSYLLLLAVVWALLESDAMEELLDQNWEQIQKVVGTDASRDDVVELMQDYMYATSGVGGAGLLMLVTALVSTVRLLGLRAIAYSCLLSLAMLGGGCVYSGIASRGEVPTATTWLLFGCGGVQVIVAICGISAFKNLNRECARWFFIVRHPRPRPSPGGRAGLPRAALPRVSLQVAARVLAHRMHARRAAAPRQRPLRHLAARAGRQLAAPPPRQPERPRRPLVRVALSACWRRCLAGRFRAGFRII